MKKTNRKIGFSIMELILAVGVFAILVGSLTVFSLDAYRASYNSQKRIEAALILQEASNSLLSIKNDNWAEILQSADGQPRRLVFANGKYSIQSGAESINDFVISITVTTAQRDGSGLIVILGGTPDERSRKIDINVAWTDNFNRSQSVNSTLFVNDWNTLLWKQTTQAEFNAGTFENTVTRNAVDGEVQLDIVAYPDWCKPTLSLSSLNLPGSAVSTSVIAIEGEAFVGTGSGSTSVNFMDIGISNSQPPIASVISTYTGNKANAVFGEANYAYLATDSDSKEVLILDITGVNPVEAGYFDAPGTANANSVFVSGNKGYVTTADSKLYVFDLTSKSGSRTQLGVKTLMGVGSEVQIVGDYAYISLTGGSHVELQVVDISTSSNLLTAGVGNTSQSDASDLFVNPDGTRAYVGTASSSTEKEFIIFNTSNKATTQSLEYFQESGGNVSIEAENFHSNISRNGKSWSLQTSTPAGASGDAFMLAGPDTGTSISTDYFNTSPELGYRVNFTSTGTYYFWVRGYAANSSSNNIHGGYDGANYPNVEALSTTSYNSWRWFRGSIDISTAEMHWINVWMQDDGFRLDKIYLTKNSSFTPSGTGNTESTRTTGSITMPEINRQLGQYETSGMSIEGVTAVENNTRAILVGTGGQEYQVLDITNEASPAKCGGMELNAGINSIASIKEADTDAFSYIITRETGNEFRVIRGGPGVGGSEGEGAVYATAGTFTSTVFDTGMTSNNFYNVLATATTPQNTLLRLQIRSSNDAAQLLTLPFLGPDGTSISYYSPNQNISIHSSISNKRYIQYKIFLESDSNATPSLDKVEINYQN